MNTVIVETARLYLDTPYVHQGRLKGVGVDCVGLLICVARDIERIPADWDITGYARVPDGVQLMRRLRANAEEIEQSDMEPGDFICAAFREWPQHVGILGDYQHGGLSLIHASNRHAKVVEHRLLFSRQLRFVAAFRL